MKTVDEALTGEALISAMRQAGLTIDSDMKSSFINKQTILASKRDELQKEREVLLAMEKTDSSENVPLHTARENISRLTIEISTLEAACATYESLTSGGGIAPAAGGVCTIGALVCIEDLSQEISWIIKLYPSGLGNAKIGAISIDTPLGKALDKHLPGDIVSCNAPGGVIKYFIKEVL